MGLALTQSPPVAERVDQLKRLVAFRVTKVEIAAEADAPRACLRFNEKIATKADLSYGDYVRATPDPDRHRHRQGRDAVHRRAEARPGLRGRVARRVPGG